MVSAVRTHPCRQPSHMKQRQVFAEEEAEEEEEEEAYSVHYDIPKQYCNSLPVHVLGCRSSDEMLQHPSRFSALKRVANYSTTDKLKLTEEFHKLRTKFT